MDFTKATIEELETVAYEDDYAGVIDKAQFIGRLIYLNTCEVRESESTTYITLSWQ